MVLADKRGRQRPAWRGVLLSVLTLGLYGRYWDYRAHHELFAQFELARDGRDEAVTWLVLGYPLPVLKFVYYHHVVTNVRYLRHRLGLPDGMSPGKFLGLLIPGVAFLLLMLVVGLQQVQRGLERDVDGSLVVADERALASGILGILFAVVVWGVLKAIAYVRLQRDINQVWDVYDWRSHQIRQAAAGAGAPGATAAAASATEPARPMP